MATTEDPHGFAEVARRRKAGRARKARAVKAAARVPKGWPAKKRAAKKAAPAEGG